MHEPQIRARLGTTAHFAAHAVVNSRSNNGPPNAQMMQEKDKLAHQLQELRLTVEVLSYLT